MRVTKGPLPERTDCRLGCGHGCRAVLAGGQVRPDMAEAASATTLRLADGSIALAVGHTDGSITVAAE